MRGGRTLIALVITAVLAPAAQAQTPGRFSVGPVVWTGNTDLFVESATNWDGTSRTAEERMRSWNALGSGMGGRIAYDFPKLVSVYGEVGAVQTTIQSSDVVDLDQTSRGMDVGTFFGVGMRMAGDLPRTETMFWLAGFGVRAQSADLETAPAQRWSYDELSFEIDGRIGVRLHQVGLYGGLRLTQLNADLDQVNLDNLPNLQTRTTELNRDGIVDLVFGIQTGVSNLAGFAELSVVGTTSATTGVTFRF